MTRQLQTLLKTTLLLLLLATASLYAGSMSVQEALNKATDYYEQKNYTEAIKYLKKSYDMGADVTVAKNLGLAYEGLKDYPNAIKWYKKAFQMGSSDAAVGLGLLYDDSLKDYPNAIKWYKKAYQAGNSTGALYLALLYDETLKDYPKAIEWYKKAIEKGDISARKDLGLLYHSQKDDLNSAVYMMGMINHPYTRDRVIGLLKDDWKIDHKTLLKAYQLQKKLIPNPYTDPIFEKELHPNQSNTSKQEEEPTNHRHGRR